MKDHTQLRFKVVGTCIYNGEVLGVRVLDKNDCELYDVPLEQFKQLSVYAEDFENESTHILMIDYGENIMSQYEIEHGMVQEYDSKRTNNKYTVNKMIADMKTLKKEGWLIDIDNEQDIDDTEIYKNDVFTAQKGAFTVQFDSSMLGTGMMYNVVRVWGYNVRLQTPPHICTTAINASYKVCSVCRLTKENGDLKKYNFMLVCNDCIQKIRSKKQTADN